jgi:hypothetical protein
MLPKSLDPDTLRTVGLVALAVIVVLALLIMRMVQKMVLKVIFLGLLVGLGTFVWYERTDLADCAKTCACSLLGVDVQVPDCPTPSG